ncbi:hypothetical protein, partial [Spiroplasma phoeniceum]|uniref:hypothetical protein n=1 Tax=Spiroplasma phoeniceum TaxID=47835 RepID=UPI003364CD4B
FNYPQYVLPPVPYNYPEYTKDIWDANTIQPLKTKIIAPAQCKQDSFNNLFSDEFNEAYYEVEIDLKQIDPTIQSISKFQDAYKTIEISNLGNLQVECGQPNIENFILDRNINILGGIGICSDYLGSLSNITLQQKGLSQTDKVNFDNIRTLYTDNITNEVQTFEPIAYTNGLPNGNYQNIYSTNKPLGENIFFIFLLQITKLSNTDKDEIKKTKLQAYYTNDLKLKIRISKIILAKLVGTSKTHWDYWGNNKDIKIDVFNQNVLGIRNKGDSPVKITIKPR